jgi:UTP--glucose-1-phosphate uridylyltransferase
MGQTISLAIIPVAGLGTRLGPITRVLPKAMFPLVGPDGAVRPVADWIARSAAAAGVERIVFITSAGQEAMLRAYFAGEADLAGRIACIADVAPHGFGYAVAAAADLAAGRPVMVLLGDHVHLAEDGPGPVAEVASAFAAGEAAAVVGVQRVGAEGLGLVGVCRGEPAGERLYRCTDIVEKPDAATAADRLITPGLPAGQYLAHAGIYAFSAEIFDCLARRVAARPDGREVGLTEAQQDLLARHRDGYLLREVTGRTLDTGTPAAYAAAVAALAGSGGRFEAEDEAQR